MSSDMDMEMEDSAIDDDPLASYDLVQAPLSVYHQTVFKLLDDYKRAQQQVSAAAQEWQKASARNRGGEDDGSMEGDSDGTRSSSSSHDGNEYMDTNSNNQSHAGSPVGYGAHRPAGQPSAMATKRLTREGSSSSDSTNGSDSTNTSYSTNTGDSTNTSDSRGSRVTVDEDNEQEVEAAVGETAHRMIEFGIAGIDRHAKTRYAIDMQAHTVSDDWLKNYPKEVSYKMDFDSMIGRCDCIPWLGSFQIFPLFKNGFPIRHSLHIGVNPLVGGYKVCFEIV